MFTMQKIKKSIKYWQNTFQVFVKVKIKNKVIFIKKKLLLNKYLNIHIEQKKTHILHLQQMLREM